MWYWNYIPTNISCYTSLPRSSPAQVDPSMLGGGALCFSPEANSRLFGDWIPYKFGRISSNTSASSSSPAQFRERTAYVCPLPDAQACWLRSMPDSSGWCHWPRATMMECPRRLLGARRSLVGMNNLGRNYETWDNNQMDLKIMSFNLNVKWKRNGFNCRFRGMCNA